MAHGSSYHRFLQEGSQLIRRITTFAKIQTSKDVWTICHFTSDWELRVLEMSQYLKCSLSLLIVNFISDSKLAFFKFHFI